MNTNKLLIRKISRNSLPKNLKELPDAPSSMHIIGDFPENASYITIVGTRKPTQYGKDVCESIISGLSGYPVVIVSGLAIGIDSIAHRSAIKHNILTVAIPGSGISESALYPRSNVPLAKEIIKSGGSITSEYDPEERAQKYMFPKRNRIMAGISDLIIIIEAEEKSGSLITAYLGLDYNKTICAVPGSIYSNKSSGTNKLIKEGAVPVTCSEDILNILNIEIKETDKNNEKMLELTKEELLIINKLKEKNFNYDTLLAETSLPTSVFNVTISKLEIKGIIKNKNGHIYKI